MLKVIRQCRCCISSDLELVHDFGKVPIADQLTISKSTLEEFPLSVVFCKNCYHFQIREDISPKILFQNNYPYYSSKIPEVVAHFRETYQSILNRIQIEKDDTVLEIAANDGVLLSQFRKKTDSLISVEPSKPHAMITSQENIETINEFFSSSLAKDILKQKESYPKLIIACNVMAHVPDTRDFAEALSILTNENTHIVIEVPHALPMLQNGFFDVIFHQHFSYFNLFSIQKLFQEFGLYINHVEEVSTQGGSLRIFASRNLLSDNSVKEVLYNEKVFGLYDMSVYKRFSNRISVLKHETLQLLKKLKAQGYSIVGYGAPGKAATYLNYFGINKEYLDVLIDISPSKQEKFFPNTGLQVHSLNYFENHQVDYIFILAWNYVDSILKNLSHLKDRGVKFIIGLPELIVIE